jgi:hypothetical protein
VIARVAHDFSAEDAATVLALLDEAAAGSDGRGAARVQLAILTLSSGNIDRLLANIDAAQKDWRDVLYWAEFPPSEEDRAKALGFVEQLRRDGLRKEE